MSKKEPQFKWGKQTLDDRCEIIVCPPYDEYKDFHLEPTGHYVLIRVNRDERKIEVALVTLDHKVIKVFQGSTAQQIYHCIFTYEMKSKTVWFIEKDHMAYLGKELLKAQYALELGADYIQD